MGLELGFGLGLGLGLELGLELGLRLEVGLGLGLGLGLELGLGLGRGLTVTARVDLTFEDSIEALLAASNCCEEPKVHRISVSARVRARVVEG